MKLILFIDSLAGGGAQRQLVNLAIGLHQRQHDVTVVTYHPLNHHLPRLETAGIPFECLNKKGRFDPSPIWRLLRMIKNLKADAVVAFLRTPAIYAEATRCLSPRTAIIVSERSGIPVSGLKASNYVAGFGHTLATQLTCNSHDYLNSLTKKLPWLRKKSTVIYNGIDTEFFNKGQYRTANANQLVTGPVKVCVVAARIVEEKGLLQLLQAVTLLRERCDTSFSIHWIGPVDPDSALLKQATTLIKQNDLEDVWNWDGPIKNIAEHYQSFDLLVLPSLQEGLPNVLCEAMASGLPVVATDIEDNTRIVEPGHNGYLCKTNDPHSLADALEKIITLSPELRHQMGKAAHDTARNLFDPIRSLDNWEQLLRKACR